MNLFNPERKLDERDTAPVVRSRERAGSKLEPLFTCRRLAIASSRVEASLCAYRFNRWSSLHRNASWREVCEIGHPKRDTVRE
jgi:hypothetical protein